MSYPVVLVILDRPSIKEPDPGRNTRSPLANMCSPVPLAGEAEHALDVPGRCTDLALVDGIGVGRLGVAELEAGTPGDLMGHRGGEGRRGVRGP